MARMNRAKASGAKTELAKYRATDSRIMVQMTSDARIDPLLVMVFSLGAMNLPLSAAQSILFFRTLLQLARIGALAAIVLPMSM